MSTKNTFLFGAALAVATAAVAVDHATHPVPERPKFESGIVAGAGLSPCAAAPCAAGAPTASGTKRAPPPPPPARPLPKGQEAPDLAIKGTQ